MPSISEQLALPESGIAEVHVLLGHRMTSVESLTNENALALRLVRTQAVPHDFWLWLGGLSSTPLSAVATWIAPQVLRSIQEIVEPNLVDANAQERIQLRETDAWIAAILGFTNRRAADLKLSFGHPMMAVSLLPLYRSLATRQLPEALLRTRHRLSEMLVLVGLVEEFGDDFGNLLQAHGAPLASPFAILRAILEVDLTTTAAITCKMARTFDPGLGEFVRVGSESAISETALHSGELEWSDPKLLWQMAAELLAKKAELVLPRQWADVAVPWTSISDHWNTLTHRLAQAATGQEVEDDSPEYNADDEIVAEMIDDLLAMQSDVAEASLEERTSSQANESGDSSVAGQPYGLPNHRTSTSRQEATGNVSQSESDEEYPDTDILESHPEPSISKIAIVEISSKTDTMFINILRRQIATARNSDNSVCLVALCVESDDAADRERMGIKSANGLAVWQDKLVNWLAEHPQVHQPFAFVTPDGQLIFSMLDIERTIATNIVREGLVTALTGKRIEDQGALARVTIPARYYAGIGSACPNAGFSAEQFIEATWRCLSAAQSQGKGTIKSIEVF